MPWVIHFSGKSAAACCIQPGSAGRAKKTPEKNCSTIANAETAVVVALALPGSAETAMPSTVPASADNTATQANVTQWARSTGGGTSYPYRATGRRIASWAAVVTSTCPALPTK
jgi:hypothetical protein